MTFINKILILIVVLTTISCTHDTKKAKIYEYSSDQKLPKTTLLFNNGVVLGYTNGQLLPRENLPYKLLEAMRATNVFESISFAAPEQRPQKNVLAINLRRESEAQDLLNITSAIASSLTLFALPSTSKSVQKYYATIVRNGQILDHFNFELDDNSFGTSLLLSSWKDSDEHIAKSVATKLISKIQDLNLRTY